MSGSSSLRVTAWPMPNFVRANAGVPLLEDSKRASAVSGGPLFSRAMQRLRDGGWTGGAARHPATDHVEDRREDQAEGGDADHAEKHRGAERLAHLGAGADRPNQWDHAEDEGERGHEDRTQPQPRRLDRRRKPVASLVLELLGELDDQD